MTHIPPSLPPDQALFNQEVRERLYEMERRLLPPDKEYPDFVVLGINCALAGVANNFRDITFLPKVQFLHKPHMAGMLEPTSATFGTSFHSASYAATDWVQSATGLWTGVRVWCMVVGAGALPIVARYTFMGEAIVSD